jgi:hypothetical protein
MSLGITKNQKKQNVCIFIVFSLSVSLQSLYILSLTISHVFRPMIISIAIRTKYFSLLIKSTLINEILGKV